MKPEIIEGNQIFWKRCTSREGAEYEVGYLTEEDALRASINMESNINVITEYKSARPSFNISVYWTVNNTWEYEAKDFISRTAIERHWLGYHSGMFYDYILRIYNNAHYKYEFRDESGDWYGLNTFRNGNHYVRYNSPRPKIISCSGC